jgi:hypothetical protein
MLQFMCDYHVRAVMEVGVEGIINAAWTEV